MNYKIVYSKRRSLAIIVSPDSGVIVRAPFRTSLRTIERFVQAKSVWINKHLDRQNNIKSLNTEFSDGMTVLYHGKELRLKIIPSEDRGVLISENTILLRIKESDDKVKTERVYKDWFMKEATISIGRKFNELLFKYGNYHFTPSALSIRALKRRWGSCSSKGKITINAELIKLSDIFTEYVILHELCHLRYHNHSSDYYRLLAEVFPEWKAVRKRLKTFHC
jgi:predicted metal-dependent hydrolase